jgi:stage V sporulation protein D (sporulation-specific penicillin-binding protein)
MGYAPADNPQIAIYVVVDRPNTNYQDDAKFATRIVRNILTETLPYLNIYMTEELSEKEQAELAELNISVKKANVIEEDTPEDEKEPEPEVNEDGSIDANGGDTTSSTPVSEEEMQSNNVDTAPLTGTLLNPGNAVIQTDGITTEDGE